MSGGKALVPELRFPEFVEAWEEKQIGFFISSLDAGVSVNSGDRPAFKDEKSVLKTSCVTLGTFDLSENKVVNEPSEIFRLKEPVKAGTIIISRMNTPQLVGANAFVTEDAPNVYLPDRLWAAKISEGGDPAWIGYVLSHPKIRSGFTDRATGTSGSMKNLSKEAVLSLPIFAPVKPEQQKIASFLDAVSKKITLLTEKRDGLVAYKRGVMQRLFSGALRFTRPDGSAFPDWEERKLGDVFDWIGTNSLSREHLTFDDESGIQNIHYGDIHTKFRALFRQSKEAVPYISVSAPLREIKEVQYLKKGDIVIADASEDYADIGKTIEVLEVDEASLIAGLHTYIARPKDGVFVSGFAGYMLRSAALRTQIMRIAQGISVLGVSKGNLEKLDLLVPHPDEQTKIAAALSALDAKIDSVNAEISQMETFKKGLLQKMFV
ncbi:restriction endonuclease subunit S [Celeribacter sp. ULVN23_4]